MLQQSIEIHQFFIVPFQTRLQKKILPELWTHSRVKFESQHPKAKLIVFYLYCSLLKSLFCAWKAEWKHWICFLPSQYNFNCSEISLQILSTVKKFQTFHVFLA